MSLSSDPQEANSPENPLPPNAPLLCEQADTSDNDRLSLRVTAWLESANDEAQSKETPTLPSTVLFNGDTGTLRLETRRCLVALLNGPSVDGRRQPMLWSVVLRDRDALQSFLHNIFLDLIIDVAQQVAFIRQVHDEGETDIPILLRRHQLTLIESALVLYLRQRLTEADSANERAVVSNQEMTEHLTLFDKARNTDLARFDRQSARAIEKCKELNLIRPIRSSDARFEVSPTLKLLFSVEDIELLTANYAALKSSPTDPAGMTLDEAIARGIAGGEAEEGQTSDDPADEQEY
jgi:hypothetical protein